MTYVVASTGMRAYGPAMFALRLLRILTLFAMLLAPLGITTAHAAMTAPAMMAGSHIAAMAPAEHCGGMDQPAGQRPDSGIDCTIACSALPALASEVAAHPLPSAPEPSTPLVGALHGLHPEFDPPPPRFA